MFRVHFLPATIGDCIWIEYGDERFPYNILVDGGTGATREFIEKRFRNLPANRRRLELAVVTHIDNDHIAGVLRLLEEEAAEPVGNRLGIKIKDVWFNGWPQLNPDLAGYEAFGVEQGERLTEQILAHRLPWNDKFAGRAVVAPETGPLPEKELDGGMRLTVLSPLPDALAAMREVWEQELRAAGLVPGVEAAPKAPAGFESFGPAMTGFPDIPTLANSPFVPDGSPANRSSIALIAEYADARLLLGADAHADVLLAGLKRYQPVEKPRVHVFKISHHGSKGTTNRELIEAVDCRRFVFSSNGSNYGHPHPEAVSRVITGAGDGAELIFNYNSTSNSIWSAAARRPGPYRFQAIYPSSGGGITIDL